MQTNHRLGQISGWGSGVLLVVHNIFAHVDFLSIVSAIGVCCTSAVSVLNFIARIRRKREPQTDQ